VFRAEDYKYSGASDYAGEKGMLEGICVFQFFKTTRKDSRGSWGMLEGVCVFQYFKL